MRNAVVLIILTTLLAITPAADAGFLWKRSGCSARVVNDLYRLGQDNFFSSRRQFSGWVSNLTRLQGLDPNLIQSRYEFINEHPELIALMKGISVPSGQSESSVTLSGGWGQDFMFSPVFPLWEAMHDNLAPLIDRMGSKLSLSPVLSDQLFRGDHISVPDSGWVLAETRLGAKIIRASAKITYYDPYMTPDGPWPRYSLESPLSSSSLLLYRQLDARFGFDGDEVLAAPFYLKSSMDHWGVLPLEAHTERAIPEHDSKKYSAQYPGLFSDGFFFKHKIYMATVIEGYGKRDVASLLKMLLDFRRRNLPSEALEVAELGRFNNPAGSAPTARTQLYYGTSLLLSLRPIRSVYLLSPLPPDPNRPPEASPAWEVVFAAPGMEWLTQAAKQTSEERNPTIPYTPNVGRDLLRVGYEELGFKVLEMLPHVFGLPNGAYIMRASRDEFVGNMVRRQLEHPSHLTPDQLEIVKVIQSDIERAKKK